MLKVPPEEVDGSSVQSTDGGQFNADTDAVAWSIPKLGHASNVRLNAQFIYMGDGKTTPKFPIYVHCTCRDEQLSEIKPEVPGAIVKLDRRFRLFHQEHCYS